MDETEEIPHWSDFKAIALSVGMALQRAREARLTGDLLRVAAFSAHTIPPSSGCECDELRQQLVETETDHLHALGRELRRSTLVTVVGILDFCLFETLMFMASIRPEVLQVLPKNTKIKNDPWESTKSALARTGIPGRLTLVANILGVADAEELNNNDLKAVLDKRHAIVHHSKFYKTTRFGNNVILEANPFPEVSHDESMTALMIVTEIADRVLVGVADRHFQADLGDLRPLTPPAAEFFREMRLKIQEMQAQGPVVEEIATPNWSVFAGEAGTGVTDDDLGLLVIPTNIDRFPAMISFAKHNVHGERCYFSVDRGEKEEADFVTPAFLNQLLAGQSLLVEYHSYSSDVPLYKRFSLDGFASKWAEARAIKAARFKSGA